jgi:hypothetical protein
MAEEKDTRKKTATASKKGTAKKTTTTKKASTTKANKPKEVKIKEVKEEVVEKKVTKVAEEKKNSVGIDLLLALVGLIILTVFVSFSFNISKNIDKAKKIDAHNKVYHVRY